MAGINDLIHSLPLETKREREAAVRDFVSRMGGRTKALPTSASRRVWTMGTMQAVVGVGYVSSWVRGWFDRSDVRKTRMMEARLEGALSLLERMSYLRGAVMKLGQLVASYPDIVPEEFVVGLQDLHFNAPPMHFSLLREYVRAELGGDPETLFASFETEAFAAASLGQVHRATLQTGERVAVKIQYPGIGDSIRSDFKALLPLLLPYRLGPDWDNLKAQLEDLKQTLLEETDYQREAELMKRCRALFSDEDAIVVPKVYQKYSTKRILTMEYLPGDHLAQFLNQDPSPEQRNRGGELILRATVRMMNQRLLYGDPSPGNFLFLPDGRLGVIDFGCMRTYSEKEFAYYREVVEETLFGDWKNCVSAMAKFFAPPESKEHKARFDTLMESITLWNCGPIRHPGPTDYSRISYLKEGVDNLFSVMRSRFTKGLGCNILATRANYAKTALFYQLSAHIDANRIFEEEALRVGWGTERRTNHVQ